MSGVNVVRTLTGKFVHILLSFLACHLASSSSSHCFSNLTLDTVHCLQVLKYIKLHQEALREIKMYEKVPSDTKRHQEAQNGTMRHPQEFTGIQKRLLVEEVPKRVNKEAPRGIKSPHNSPKAPICTRGTNKHQ